MRNIRDEMDACGWKQTRERRVNKMGGLLICDISMEVTRIIRSWPLIFLLRDFSLQWVDQFGFYDKMSLGNRDLSRSTK